MPRVISFILLIAILLLVGAKFFEVVMQFAVPLFLAAVLVVVFKPMHERVRRQLPGRPRLAALTTTTIILLIVLAPTTWLGWKAYVECARLVQHIQASADSAAPSAESSTNEAQPESEAKDEADEPSKNPLQGPIKIIEDRFFALTGIELKTDALLEKAAAYIPETLLNSVQVLFNVALGLAIMVLALYYFLADGPAMIRTAMRLSPLDDVYEQELLDQFANVSRAVVVASLLSAVAQGLLAGIGYYFALPEGSPLFLLTMLTMAFAIVPFIGAAAIWAPTAAWIYLSQGADGGDPSATMRAVLLLAYGCCVISMVDNIIKPFVLHGQSNMHPLLALISVLGGVQVLGPIGILVGPMLVAFVQAVLNMLNKELKLMGDVSAATKKGEPDAIPKIHPALMAEAEAVAVGNVGLLDQISAATALPMPPHNKRSDSGDSSERPSSKSDSKST